MPLRTVHQDGRVKTPDEVIDFIERFNGAKLMPYQKLFVKTLYKTNRTFISMPTHLGYMPKKTLSTQLKTCKK